MPDYHTKAPQDCEAVKYRKMLTMSLIAAQGGSLDDPAFVGLDEGGLNGSEAQLLRAWEMLRGVVAEYTNGGDEVAEMCNCTNHRHVNDHPGMTFDNLLTVPSIWRWDP